ncbi:hemolysin XhlA family protein [Limosilactobacillus fermentum]|uniref:hemolysin XhlA family protein n=1 Tax=Limosilactobacillus fermentum TaxID=1613 RepID=UPI001E522CBE|nr:hemolysin XhlA family protein [Limosilactobacillus fermentum]
MVNDLDNEKVVELLIDIQSRLGRIEERVSRQEGVEAKADEALASAKLNEEKYSEVESRVTKLEQSRDWTNRTAIGAIISAAVAILSVVFPHIGG